MARESKGKSGNDSEKRSNITLVDAIREITRYNANAELDNEHQLLLFLHNWWCKTYSRPYKDPLLQTYTLEELLYEFFDRIEREKAAETQVDEDADRIEDKRVQENLDWAEEEERRELEALRKQQEEIANKANESSMNPAEDPDNKTWMEEVMQREIEAAKKIYGDDFGEDIKEDFE